MLLQSETDDDAKTILAKITDTEYLMHLYDIKLFDINSDKAVKIRRLIHNRQTQLIIKIEGDLKIYKERRIELEERLKLFTDNILLYHTRFSDQESINLQHRSQRYINDTRDMINEAKELHSKATEMLQHLIKSGDLHTKKGEMK